MIEIFKAQEGRYEPISKPIKGCWINAIDPSHEEIQYLQRLLEIPPEIIDELRDPDEIPGYEEHDDTLLIIVRVPRKANEIEYNTVPVGIFVRKEAIITICFYPHELTAKLQNSAHQNSLVLSFLLCCSKMYLHYLMEINKTINLLETRLNKHQKQQEITKLLGIEKSLVYFNTSLRANELPIARIEQSKMFIKTPRDRKLLRDIQDENKQAIAVTNIYTNILSNLMDAFVSMISNNLNVVMRLLTSITIMIALPTLIASFYGMNVHLPFQDSPHAFMIVMTISIIISTVFLIIFWRHNLF